MTTDLINPPKQHHELKKVLRDLLKKGKAEFAMVLPQHMSPERMIRIAITACTMQPKLLNCTKESVALALLTASQTGLEPDGYHGHLVPYGNVCQFIPDYKGLIQLALDNGVVIDAAAVREKDLFSYELGTQQFIKHIPSEEADRGPLRCSYAVATFENGRTKFTVATRADVQKRRSTSKAVGGDSPWAKWEEEMWIKTAVKMLMKFIPRSPAMKAAVIADDTAEIGIPQHPNYILSPPRITESAIDEMEVPTEQVESKTEKAARSMKKKKETATTAEEPVAETKLTPTPVSAEAMKTPSVLENYMKQLSAATTEKEARQAWSEHVFEYKDVLPPEVYGFGCEKRDAKLAELKSQGGEQ